MALARLVHTSAPPAPSQTAPLQTPPPPSPAAIARQIYVRQGLGVGQLRIKFGGRNKTRGVRPEHFKKASGGLIRHIMKQLETCGFMEKHDGGRLLRSWGDEAGASDGSRAARRAPRRWAPQRLIVAGVVCAWQMR